MTHSTEEARLAPLTEMQIDLLDHALAEDGCHGFYADHVHTNRAVMQIAAQAKAEALEPIEDLLAEAALSPHHVNGYSYVRVADLNEALSRIRPASGDDTEEGE